MTTIRASFVRPLSIAAIGAALATACGGGGAPAPADPATTVQAFLEAVRANDLRAMGRLWGTSRGPAAGRMPAEELERRLTVMRIYLAHERFEILPDLDRPRTARPVLRVRLTRRGCLPVVPFTMTRHGDGWLIQEIDLAAAGNPQRTCQR